MLRDFIIRLYHRAVKKTTIYRYCNIYGSAKIGNNCIIGSYTEIGEGVKVGDNCKIGAYVFIPKGVTIGNDVFVGPRTGFTNDLYPKAVGKWKVRETVVEDGASVGAGCTIICGVRIGRDARVGAGAVVTKDVAPGKVVVGVPAKEIESSWGKKGLAG